MSAIRVRAAVPLLACLLATLLTATPARAASAPQISVDSPHWTFTEYGQIVVTGTWTESDGDLVVMSADIGDADSGSAHGTWSWRPSVAIDGPGDVAVTVTATDGDGSNSVSFSVHIDNSPPEAWTHGPRFVPAASVSDRTFLWSTLDALDAVTTTADCGSGTVTATGDGYVSGTHTLRCSFSGAGQTLVGVRASDDDGGSTDGRLSVRATTQVTSVGDGRLVINGQAGNDQMGGAIATPDLNGDGKADIVIGGTATSNGPVHDPGYVMVVFGRSAAGAVDLGTLAAGTGFRIHGATDEALGRTLASAGDVNNDGFDDLLIGATEGAAGKGVVYLIFGSASSADIDLPTLAPSRGVRITGAGLASYAGTALAGIGDANGDGFDDFAIGSPGFNATDGRVDLLFGRASFTAIDLAALPANRGIHITGPGSGTGQSVAGGDVNGDGRDDVVVGTASGWDSNVVVIYGKTTMADIDAAAMSASQGFEIGGGEGLGMMAVAAGDTNGDGYADVVIAHPGWGHPSAWPISIVRGGPTNASIPYLTTAPASRLTRVYSPIDSIRSDLTTLDWNGDGKADILVGGGLDNNNGEASGSAFLIKGTAVLSNIDLSTYDPRWFRVDGDNPYAYAGDGVAAGDVTGDGTPDLLVGAPGSTSWAGPGAPMPGRVGVFAGTKSDVTAPIVTAPIRSMPLGKILVGSAPIMRLTWTGADSGSGVDHYLVAQQTNTGAWLTVASTTVPRLDRALATTNAYRFRVRAVDRLGNWSNWTYGTAFRLTGYQDASASIAYRGTWRTGTSASYAGGTTRFATAAGARATLTFTGRQIGFAAPTGPTRGTAYVYVNGSYVGAISLYSTTGQASHVVASWSWSSSATRTISFRVVGSGVHRRFDIDKFIVVR